MQRHFLAAITGAAWTWNLVPEADFNLIYGGETDATDVSYNQADEVVFVDRGEITEDGYSAAPGGGPCLLLP